MLDTNDLQAVIGQDVYGSDGDKIGSAGQVYFDDESGRPDWVTVKTGLFGTKETFVPLTDAQTTAQGLTVPFTKDQVKDAPNVDADQGHLSEEEEERLYRHYGREGEYSEWRSRGTEGTESAGGQYAGGREDYTGDRGTVGRDTSGPSTDDAMTRSEERLNVGTESRESGRARLRKYVVTEEENVTVPVQREKVRVEREPITDANRGKATSGPAISEEEHEVVLREERPVVEKEAVPVERVRLDKETVTEQEQVSEEVRKERIETEGDTDRR